MMHAFLLRSCSACLIVPIVLIVMTAGPSFAQASGADQKIAEAQALLDRGEGRAALDLMQRAVDATGSLRAAVPYLRIRGYIEGLLGRHEAALATYSQVMEVTPNDEFVLLDTANRLRALGRLGEARTRYRSFIQGAKPGSPMEIDARNQLRYLETTATYDAEVEKKIRAARTRLYGLGGVAVLVLLGTLTVIRRLCR